MNLNYKDLSISNYIIKVTGVFNYNSAFKSKALDSGYQNLLFTEEQTRFFKDYFYPDLRHQFFSNDDKRHEILHKDFASNSCLELFLNRNENGVLVKSKQASISVQDSRIDLFEDGFGLFTLNIKLINDEVSLSAFSDASFLLRNFESLIEDPNAATWHKFIENEFLLGSDTRGESIKVDDYSGSKYKLYMVLDIPELEDSETIEAVLFDIGTIALPGSAISNSYDSLDKNYIKQLLEYNTISIYNNWKGLSLLDTFTIVGKDILKVPYLQNTYNSTYYSIYLYCLFIKYNLFKFNYEITDLDEDRRQYFQGFLAKYYYNYISYNFLPTEIFNKIRTALDIEKELLLIQDKIRVIGVQIQEEQQDRTNVILGIVTVFASFSSAQPVYEILVAGQKSLGWNNGLFWGAVFIIVISLIGLVLKYLYGKQIAKWTNKKKNK
jgi:hypothetical protein